MPSAPNLHTTATALQTRRLIRSAKPGKRRAFALGVFGGLVVMFARRGKPAAALSDLRKLDPPAEASPGDRKAKLRELTSGLLYWDGDVLVLQCRKRVNGAQVAKARTYFKLLKAGRPWNKLRITRLADGDEGDPEETVTTEEAVINEIVDDGQDDQIQDDWGEDDVPAAATLPEREETARQLVDAAVIADTVLSVAPMLKLDLGPAGDMKDAFVKSIAALLDVMSPDRLMLALCYSANIEEILDNKDYLSRTYDKKHRGRPRSGQEPIANDEDGRAEISDALAAYGRRVALGRGLLAPGETVKPDARMDKMVEQVWQKDPQASFDTVLRQLLGMFSVTFEQADAKRTRGMLGLSAAKPPADWTRLTQAAAGWSGDASAAIAGMGQVKEAILAEYKDEADAQPSIDRAFQLLDGVAARLDGPFTAALDQVAGAKDDDERETRRHAVYAEVTGLQGFLQGDEVASSLDGNEFFPAMTVVAPLLQRLDDMQAALERAA